MLRKKQLNRREKPMDENRIRKHLKAAADKWPSAFIARQKVSEFTGGLITRGHIANLDCRGEGPEMIKIGRKACYPVKPFIEWLESRIDCQPHHWKKDSDTQNK